MTERLSGRVVHWNEDRGYGFIWPTGGGGKLFFHRTDLESAEIFEVQRGDELTFVLGSRNDKPLALEIEKAGGGW